MAKKPEDFKEKSGDRSLKTKILQLEKRFVEADLAVNEVKDLLKQADVGSFPDLRQRVNDLEDLIVVENVGITELKNMLIALQEGLKRKVPPEFEKKVNKMDERIVGLESSIKELPARREMISPERFAELEKNLQNVNAQLGVLNDKVENLKPSTSVGLLTKRIDEMGDELDTRIRGIEGDLAFVKEKSTTFSVPETLAKDIEEARSNFTINNARLEAMENAMKEFATNVQAIKQDIKGSAHVEGLEQMVKEYGKELDKLKPAIKKMASFEKITNLKEDVENKLEEFRVLQEETEKLAKKTKSMYSGVDKRAEIVKEFESNLPALTESINELKKDVDKTKSSLSKKMKIVKDFEVQLPVITESINKLEKKLEKGKGEFSEVVKKEELTELVKRNEESFKGFEKRLDNLKSGVQESTAPFMDSIAKLDRRLNMLEETQGEVMKGVGDVTKRIDVAVKSNVGKYEDLSKRFESIDKLDKRMSMLEKTQGEVMKEKDGLSKSVNETVKKTETISRGLGEITKNVNSVVNRVENYEKIDKRMTMLEETQGGVMKRVDGAMKRMEDMGKFVESAKADVKILGELNKRLNETKSRIEKLGASVGSLKAKKPIDDVMPFINKKIAEMQEPTAVLNAQVADLLDRIVFLESRLGAIESEMQKKISVQPIVLE